MYLNPAYRYYTRNQALDGGNTDPHFASVVLLAANNNGADTTTTFIDQSTSAKTITTLGNAQWDTAQAPTGLTSSLLLDGTGDYLSLADSGDWDFGTGDFTTEFWIRFAVVPSGGAIAFPLGNYGSSTTGWFTQYRDEATDVLAFGTSGDTPLLRFAWTPAADTWYAVSTTRSGSNLRSFIGGTQIGITETNSEDITGSTAVLMIGGLGTLGAQFVNGWMASVRVTKGVARYTGNYTPPTLPLPTS